MADWYEVTGAPGERAALTSATIRAEFTSISAQMAKLPDYTGNGALVVAVNAAGTELEAVTSGLALVSPVLNTPQIHDTSADHHYVYTPSELTGDRNVTLPLLTTHDEFTFNDHTQSLTNKTLVLPVIAQIVNTGTLTLPSSTDTLVARNTTDTMTNKSLTSPIVTGTPTAAGATWANLGTATTIDIDGGTADGVTIGGSVAAPATVTSLTATGGGSLTGTWSDLGTVTTMDLDGGSIDGAVIGAAAAAAATVTVLTASTSLQFATGATVTTILDEDAMGSNSATALATQQSIKAYVDAQDTGQDLDFQGDAGGALSIDLDAEVLVIAGGTGISTTGAINTLTIDIDSTVATLTGSQTLTNKSLTSPTVTASPTAAGATWADLGAVTTIDINGGTADGMTIGGTAAAPGTFTTLNANGGGALTGTWTDLGSVTTVDINGGTVDGATIGGAAAGAGTFTTLTANTNLTLATGATVTAILDEDAMASNSATALATQQSIRAYVTNAVSASLSYQGGYDANTNTPDLDTSPSGITANDFYIVTVAGNFFAVAVNIGDQLIAEITNPTIVTDWTIVAPSLTDAQIKTQYENNADTNEFSDAEQTKLAAAATLTDTQTLTNKTLTSPVLTTPQINNPALTFQYVFAGSAIVADRTVTLPLLTGPDTFVFNAFAATLTNKTIDTASNTITVVEADISDLGAYLTSVDNSNWSGADLVVANGGTGAGTFTDGGVLLGSGTGAITPMARLLDSEMIVGQAAGDPVIESGATLRTSIGCDPIGTDNSTDVTLAGSYNYLTLATQEITLNAIDLTVTTGDITGTLAIAHGGTGVTTASAARTAFDVDQAGTDNSTNVTLAAGLNYLSIAGQEITMGQINFSTDTTGTVGVANGGTGQTTAYTNGQLLIGNSTGNTIVPATLTEGEGIDITNGASSITILCEAASTTNVGAVELATVDETNTGTSSTLALTPAGLEGWTGGTNLVTLGTLPALQVDNINVNLNTISSTTGALNITPVAGSAIVLDTAISVDGGVITGVGSITSTTTLTNTINEKTADTGVTVEGVLIKDGIINGNDTGAASYAYFFGTM